MTERFLVTGADGCLGAWVVRLLLDEGAEVVAFDVGANDRRHELVSGGAPLGFRRVVGDITDRAAVAETLAGIDRVIHLAALQVPLCRADPSTGAAVNVQGTVNMFEAALEHGIAPVVYASSIAVYGTADDYPSPVLSADDALKPTTLYGVYKVANEQTAAIYAADHGLASVGLRPHTVYGAGRDQGLTSQPTAAIASALRSEPYSVDYGGVLDFQYARDVARVFIAAARAEFSTPAAPVLNTRGHVTAVSDFVDRVRRITGFDDLTVGADPLPFPHAASPAGLADLLGEVAPTPLDDAIAETAGILSASL
ncbi:MAG: NAD-dependent epimerase/dehydratase family protein [Acidimicrobiaceae bacterium]|nr:NAD-dependent epimerase/dehydratase family protein [Acidimicrobiaceae bacterium]